MNKKIMVLLGLVLAVGVRAGSSMQTGQTQRTTHHQQQSTQSAGRILSEPQVRPVSASTDTSWRVAQQKKDAGSSVQRDQSESSQVSTSESASK